MPERIRRKYGCCSNAKEGKSMSVNSIGAMTAAYTQQSTATKTNKESSSEKTSEKKAQEPAAVYEKNSSEKTQSTKSNPAIIAQLKADTQARTAQLQSLVEKMISKQGQTLGTADSMWSFLAKGNLKADPETIAQAQKDVAADGYWGAEQTSDRILSFAKALANDDPDKAEELLNGHRPTGPWRGNKYSAFEGGTAIPAIVRWPKRIKGNAESDVLMSQIDWMASLGALIDARIPKGGAPDSENRLGNLLGTDMTDRPWILELAANHVLSVRDKDWKYIEPNDGPAMITWGPKIETGNSSVPQLYEMNKVTEKENVASQYPDKVFELQNILRRVRQK